MELPNSQHFASDFEARVNALREAYLPEVTGQDLDQLAGVVSTLASSPRQLYVLLSLLGAKVSRQQEDEASGSAELA